MASGTSHALTAVQFVDAQTGWVAGEEGTVLHTSDGGKTWVSQNSQVMVNLMGLTFTDRNHGWAVSMRGQVVHTVDGGRTRMVKCGIS